MPLPFRKKCLFGEIWGSTKKHSPRCERYFFTNRSPAVFCKACHSQIANLRAKGFLPKDHPATRGREGYTSPWPKDCRVIPSMMIQRMSPSKLFNLGVLGVDFVVAPTTDYGE